MLVLVEQVEQVEQPEELEQRMAQWAPLILAKAIPAQFHAARKSLKMQRKSIQLRSIFEKHKSFEDPSAPEAPF